MKTVLLFLALALPAWAQGPFVGPLPRLPLKAVPKAAKAPVRGVSVPEEVRLKPGRLARVEALASDGKPVRWINVHDALDLIESETGRWAIVTSPIPGRYKVACYSDAGGPPSYVVVVVEGEVPAPPKPPDPGPGPKPPDPPGPTPAGPLRVLVVFDEETARSLPKEQHSVLYGKRFHDHLNARTTPDAALDGKNRWFIIDKDTSTAAMPKEWQDAAKRERKSLPWIVLFGDGGAVRHEGPLPGTPDEAIKLVDAYAPKAGRKEGRP